MSERVEAPLVGTVPRALEILSISQSQLYRLIARGVIDARKCGRRTLIVSNSLHTMAEQLPRKV